MFTGIVECMGRVVALRDEPPGKRLRIQAKLARTPKLGDSICVNGCCLTVVSAEGELIEFQAGPETLNRTNLGGLVVRSAVNLESSLGLGDTLGGHLVTGHVDATGTLLARQDQADWSTFWIGYPSNLGGQLADKGSVAVDGVSLTLVEVQDDRFSVALIPHTLAVTTLGQRQVQETVNLETDLLAKYVQRQLAWKLAHDRTHPSQ